ncbi:hypothetical protein CC78DRAFT_41608 [Lojkania enalia]|uniref:Uncharacterized protein n=1 Tax=Lojkania enalia TaxID=147567 RepID=A0A9P4MWA1_9PLEO|nr:hypothetical protein CC78DRAFT_41608 [Didymosphaeria enalia]
MHSEAAAEEQERTATLRSTATPIAATRACIVWLHGHTASGQRLAKHLSARHARSAVASHAPCARRHCSVCCLRATLQTAQLVRLPGAGFLCATLLLNCCSLHGQSGFLELQFLAIVYRLLSSLRPPSLIFAACMQLIARLLLVRRNLNTRAQWPLLFSTSPFASAFLTPLSFPLASTVLALHSFVRVH